MEKVKSLDELKNVLDELKNKRANIQGELKALMKQLEQDFGLKDLESAKKILSQLEIDIGKNQEEYDSVLAEANELLKDFKSEMEFK